MIDSVVLFGIAAWQIGPATVVVALLFFDLLLFHTIKFKAAPGLQTWCGALILGCDFFLGALLPLWLIWAR